MDTDRTSSQPRAKDASGILAVRTGVLRKRGFRRKLPRPGSGFLLFLFLAIAVGGAAAALHRRVLEREFASQVTLSKATPFEIKRIRRELLSGEPPAEITRQEVARVREILSNWNRPITELFQH